HRHAASPALISPLGRLDNPRQGGGHRAFPHRSSRSRTIRFPQPQPLADLAVSRPHILRLWPRRPPFPTDRRQVWLTIDDGPDPLTTPRVLDLLDAHRARATFFVIGQKAARHPSLIAEITRRGHTLGNHTHNHPLASYWIAGATRTGREIDACNAAL